MKSALAILLFSQTALAQDFHVHRYECDGLDLISGASEAGGTYTVEVDDANLEATVWTEGCFESGVLETLPYDAKASCWKLRTRAGGALDFRVVRVAGMGSIGYLRIEGSMPGARGTRTRLHACPPASR